MTSYTGASFVQESSSPRIYSGLLDGWYGYYSAPPDVYFSGDFTITAFVNVVSTANWARLIDFGNFYFDGYNYVNIDNILFALSSFISGQPLLRVYNGSSFNAMNNPSSNALSTSVWTHVAGILKANNISLFLNCTMTNSETITLLPRKVVRNYNYIGRSNWQYDDYANAKFRNVRIYNRALSTTELRTDFNNQ